MDRSFMELQFAKQKVDDLNRTINYLTTGIRNALTDLEDDDIVGAIETLKQFMEEE